MWCHKVERDAHPSAWAVGEEQLPPLTLDQLKDVCRSYAPSAGLGWDGLNPRVLLQLGDDALQPFLHIVVTFEECPGTFETAFDADHLHPQSRRRRHSADWPPGLVPAPLVQAEAPAHS